MKNRLDHFDQLITTMQIIQTFCDGEIHETNENIVVEMNEIQFIERKIEEGKKKIIKKSLKLL